MMYIPTEIFNKIQLSCRINKQYLQGLPWLGCLGLHIKNHTTTLKSQLLKIQTIIDNNELMSCTCRKKAATE